MKANEIRLSNWFIGYDDKPFKWEIEHFANLATVYPDEIIKAPIPLTEEILLKAGFEKHRKGYSLNVGGESFDYYIKDKFVIWDHKHRGYSLESIRSQGFIFYKYLHQLQNLFFALTGEEIKIEL